VAQSDDIAWFETNRGYISTQYPGQYVLIKDKAVIGAYPDWTSAFQAGTVMFGADQFTVKQATPVERIEYAAAIGMRRLRMGQQYQQQFQNAADKLRQDGAIVQVTVTAPSAYQQQAAGQGRTAGTPQTVQGLVDTGASISTVSDRVAGAAGLVQTGSVPIGGVGGTSERPIFAAAFTLPQYGVTIDPLEVGGVTIPMPGVDILIGRDVLKAVHLAWQGPAGLFNLTHGEAAAQQGALPGSPAAAAAPRPGAAPGTTLIVGAGVAAIAAIALFALDVI
jgi:hypothetical protein